MGLFSETKERRTQVLIRDDGTFQIRKLNVLDSFLVEKDNNDNIIRAWLMPYKLLKRFDGYKNMSADMVTLSGERDIILDLFDELNIADKPGGGESGKTMQEKIAKFIGRVAASTCYRIERTAKPKSSLDKVVNYLGAAIALLTLGLVIVAIT